MDCYINLPEEEKVKYFRLSNTAPNRCDVLDAMDLEKLQE